MRHVQYIAVMEAGLNDSYGVWFPDLPGCVTAGHTEQEARALAAEALALHVEGLIEDGQALPVASSIHAFGPEDVGSGFMYLFVVDAEAPDAPPPKTVRLNITMPEPLLQRIDQVAGDNRSGWLAEAAKDRLRLEAGRRANTNVQAAAGIVGRAKRR